MGTDDKDIRNHPLDDIKAAIEQKGLPEHEKEKLLAAHKKSPAIAATASATAATASAQTTATAAADATPKASSTPPPAPPQPPVSHTGAAKGFWGAVIAAALIIGALFFITTHHHREAEGGSNKAYTEGNAKGNPKDATSFYAVKSPGATASDAAKAMKTAEAMQRKSTKALKKGEKAPVVVYLFNYDNSGVPESKVLNDAARRAKESDATVAVVAYTDKRGADSYNMRLSQQRADAIARYLVAHGVPASHIKAKGMGETNAFGSDLQCRRAVLTFN